MARSSDYKGEDLITPISRINIRRVCQAIPGRHDVRYSASERDTRKYESGEICRIQEMDQGDTLTGYIISRASCGDVQYSLCKESSSETYESSNPSG